MATTEQTRIPSAQFERLCSIQRRLHRWAEDECNGRIQWEGENEDQPRRYHLDRWGSYTIRGAEILNSEARWLKQAQTIAAQCGGLIYHQTDPRGCALYFYRLSDIEGRGPIDQCYSTAALACC